MRLPISSLEAELRPLTGLVDAYLAESGGTDAAAAVELLDRLVLGGGSVRRLPVPDIEALMVELRRRVFGDRVLTSTNCRQPGCGARVEIEFNLADFLAHYQPAPVRGVGADPEQPGWFTMADTPLRFRVPTADDQIEAALAANPVAFLARRTMAPPDLPAKLRRRAERAMEKMAPTLSTELRGVCPDCGVELSVAFDVCSFILTELRQQAAFLFEDVHTLASVYHWPEHEILALPSARRARYAVMVQKTRENA